MRGLRQEKPDRAEKLCLTALREASDLKVLHENYSVVEET